MNVIAKDARAEIDLSDPRGVRRAARTGHFTDHTSRAAPGFVQANLAILPKDYAEDFFRFCQRNPRPCPVLEVTEPGDPGFPTLAEDLDVRSDVPSYRVFRDGEYAGDVGDITELWRDDLVAFALGCALSVDLTLIEAGVPVRHVEQNSLGPMYITNIPTAPAGPFRGSLVVSMKPLTPANAIRAIQITSRFPRVHGAPVHMDRPDLIGIENVMIPDFGPERAQIEEGEIPVFWACGVTPQVVVREARPPLCITHTPGHMLVTDLRNATLAAF